MNHKNISALKTGKGKEVQMHACCTYDTTEDTSKEIVASL
jgi:hypothetical protein